jgi:predicted acylesterase/phospholipase RssA/CRP-like cAMP-binding protein
MIGRNSESRMFRALKRMTALKAIENERWDQLAPFISFVELASEEVLFHAGSRGDKLYFVIDGEMELFLNASDALEEPFYLHSRRKGETVGDFAVLNGGDHLVTAVAKKTSHVAVFPREAFELLNDIHPTLIEMVYDTAAELSHRVMVAHIYLSLFGSMSTKAMNDLLDATDIRHHRNGDVLFKQSDEPDGLYVVVSGRLHVEICRNDGTTAFKGEIFAPEPVGELAMLSDGLRSATVTAARESTVAFLNKWSFKHLVADNAERLTSLSKVIIKRHANTDASQKRSQDRTFVIVPLDPRLPMRRFSQQLKRELRRHIQPLVVDSNTFDKMYGRKDAAQTRVIDKFNSSLSNWLEDKENTFGSVVYIADPSWTPWTRRCLQRADRILFVGDASEYGRLGGTGNTDVRDIENQVAQLFTNPNTQPRRELVLLHPANTHKPKGTKRWLEGRHLDAYHHVRLDDKAHIARLARRMLGKARGLVLSGGGARGYAHLGVHRFMEEQNTTIDYIGGSSMGALLGASMAMGSSSMDIAKLSSEYASKKALFDYTLPLASLLKSEKLSRFCKVVYQEDRIEDLWTPFFCVSSNLSSGQEVVHDRGSLWLAIRTTVSLPGLFSPVPTEDGQLLIDGAVLNTFPVDIMRERLGWQGEIIGVNVSQINEMTHDYDFGTTLSGWSVFWSRINPLQARRRVPRLVETLLRSTDIKGIERLQELKRNIDVLIEPDVSEISLLDFKSYARIADMGYEAARVAFNAYEPNDDVASPETVMESALSPQVATR